MKQKSYEVGLEQLRRHRNVVVRDVRDAQGNQMGIVVEPHDASEAGVIAAAQRATERMYAEYPGASNIESRIAATDDSGRPKWSISPNFQHLAEIGTAEARYIWGDLAGAEEEPRGIRRESAYCIIEAKKPISG